MPSTAAVTAGQVGGWPSRLLPTPTEMTDSPSAMMRMRSYRSVQCSADATPQPQVPATRPVEYWSSTTKAHSPSRTAAAEKRSSIFGGINAATPNSRVLPTSSGVNRRSWRRSFGLSRTACR